MKTRILVVDDEPSIRKVLEAHLTRAGHDVVLASDGLEAIVTLEQELFHLVVTDLRMPGLDGMGLLRWINDHQPGLPVIVITAHGTVDTAVEALKSGAHDYVTKPFDTSELQTTIVKAIATERRRSRQWTSEPNGRFDLIGRTPAMRQLYALVERIAPSPTTVLITGESGTGKEMVARALHHASDRSSRPFIHINCGAIPENLFESELFGYEPGAFIGAVSSKPGRLELADGGTLFLDEVGELPKDMQVKLLSVLQQRQVERVGGLRPLPVDVRVIAATHINLQKSVMTGLFREDLYYRLNVIPLHLPPLRERVDDLPLLVDHFLNRFNQRLRKNVRSLTPAAAVALATYHWPGNIRELENLMERSVLLAVGEVLDRSDLVGFAHTTNPSMNELESLDLKEYVRVHTARLERDRIIRVLTIEDHNVTRAARRLGISRKGLQLKMKEYGLRSQESHDHED